MVVWLCLFAGVVCCLLVGSFAAGCGFDLSVGRWWFVLISCAMVCFIVFWLWFVYASVRLVCLAV